MANLRADPINNSVGVAVTGVDQPGGGTAAAVLPAMTLRNEDGTAASIGGSGASAQQVQGNVASGAADSGNPVKVGGRYNDASPTLTNGQRGDLQLDTAGDLKVVLSVSNNGAAIAGTAANQDGLSGGINTLGISGFSVVWNGATWDRQRGDTAGTDVIIGPRATAGGVTQFRRLATADTNLAVVKASAGRVYGYTIANTSAAVKFVKLYNKATAPVLASDTPLRTIMIPAGGIAAYHIGMGLAGFSAGIAIAATGAVGDTDTTALNVNDLIISIDYA